MMSEINELRGVTVSVVIATYNRAQHLAQCLATFEGQDLDRSLFEVIVINDGSTDMTEKILTDFANRCRIQFRTFYHANAGVAVSRNIGIKLAAGEYVAFTDDDCRLPAWWLSRFVAHIRSISSDVVGVGGPLDCIVENGGKLSGRFIQYLDEFNYIPVVGHFRVRPLHVSRLAKGAVVPYLRTANAMFRRDSLLEVSGFDETFRRPGGEDPDLCYRLLAQGARFEFDRGLVVHHVSRSGFRHYFRSLSNYVHGEFKSRKNRHIYPRRAIRRCYEFIPLQKLASLVLSLVSYPLLAGQLLIQRQFTVLESFLFPLIVLASKAQALFSASGCQLCEWLGKNP